jgi:hypothetical protein
MPAVAARSGSAGGNGLECAHFQVTARHCRSVETGSRCRALLDLQHVAIPALPPQR